VKQQNVSRLHVAVGDRTSETDRTPEPEPDIGQGDDPTWIFALVFESVHSKRA
jgi:hypothetical protein